MFYLLSILSMLGYSVQSALLGHFSRKIDPLDMTVYRNLSFLLTLSPLLFLSDTSQILAAFQYWPQFLLTGFTAVLALWGMFFAFRYLPIGIAGSFRSAATAIFVIALSYFIFKEVLSAPAIFLIGLAIASTIFLGSQKNPMPHLNGKTFLGIVVLVLTALPAAVSVFTAAWLSRHLDPFVAGYFWEASVGLAAFATVIFRFFLSKKRFEWVGFKQAGMIALAAWPTLIGTGAFVLATSRGPVAIVSAIGLASVVVSTFIAHFFFQEKLNVKQWLGMGLILVVLAGLKFV